MCDNCNAILTPKAMSRHRVTCQGRSSKQINAIPVQFLIKDNDVSESLVKNILTKFTKDDIVKICQSDDLVHKVESILWAKNRTKLREEEPSEKKTNEKGQNINQKVNCLPSTDTTRYSNSRKEPTCISTPGPSTDTTRYSKSAKEPTCFSTPDPSTDKWDGVCVNDTIDYIVQNGHQMYQHLISQSNNPTPRFLGHWELPHYVQQNNESIEIHRYENILNGVVAMDSNFPFTTVSIEEALPMAFSISNYFICTFGDSTIAIFRLERSEQWFIFDSHSRNSTGITNPFGSATIIELSNSEQCVQFLRQNYEGTPFEITTVVFERQDVQSIDYSAPENNLIESMDVPIETNEENNHVKYITEPQGTHENPQDVQINNKKISTLILMP
ncbi:unnamed protein product [Mytilus coruscus]|uniref:Uncharacterized protein n=1 Tax=Mytilus coruscus TaxID=42192 RepID=A0A6J8CBB4_MYTCO|nr:unnamed protein product [Mytilus coruscus]